MPGLVIHEGEKQALATPGGKPGNAPQERGAHGDRPNAPCLLRKGHREVFPPPASTVGGNSLMRNSCLCGITLDDPPVWCGVPAEFARLEGLHAQLHLPNDRTNQPLIETVHAVLMASSKCSSHAILIQQPAIEELLLLHPTGHQESQILASPQQGDSLFGARIGRLCLAFIRMEGIDLSVRYNDWNIRDTRSSSEDRRNGGRNDGAHRPAARENCPRLPTARHAAGIRTVKDARASGAGTVPSRGSA